MGNTILNASSIPLNVQTGTVPDVGEALTDWFQPMTFGVVTKVITAFQVYETVVDTNFRGVIQPLTKRDLKLRPEGQRAWTPVMLHSDPSLQLQVDNIVLYLDKQYRVLARSDYQIYGYLYYELIQDYTNSGPYVATTTLQTQAGDDLLTEAGDSLLIN